MQTERAARQLMTTPWGRRKLAKHSPAFFDAYYCGMEPAAHRQRWMKRAIGAYVRGQLKEMRQNLLILGPRKHGKTELMVTLICLFILLNRDIRILVICSTEDNAKKRLKRIKHVLKSPRVQADWCDATGEPLLPEKRTDQQWASTGIEVLRDAAHIEPTVEVVGIGGSITGGHYDVIFLDDVEIPKLVKNATMRQATRTWLREVVYPMLSTVGFLCALGTRKHYDDLYSHLLKDPAWGVTPEWERKAIIKEPAKAEPIYEIREGRRELVGFNVEGDYEVLWPEWRDIHYLLRERHGTSTAVWSREYQNQVQSDEGRLFKIDWLDAAEKRGKLVSIYDGPFPDDLVVVQAWDLALVTDAKQAQATDSDYTVGVTWGWDPATDHRWVLGLYRNRGIDPDEMLHTILSEFERWPRHAPDGVSPFIRSVAVEKNAFATIHTWGLTTHHPGFPLVPHTTTGKNKADPYEGLPIMQHVWEKQGVVLPSRTLEDEAATLPLRAEHEGFGLEAHDDTVLACWIAERVLRVFIAQYKIAMKRIEEAARRRGRRQHH